MKKLNVAVIGLGYWGPNLIRNFFEISSVESIWGYDIDNNKIRDCKKKFPFIETTNTYDRILLDPKVDVIAIATPSYTHYKLAKKALLNNKHVLIEKPMSQTSKQAEELLLLAKKKGRVIMAGHTFVYSESVREIKKNIEKNRLGEVYYYDSTRINLGNIQNDVNVIWDLAPHDLSILNYLFKDKPKKIKAHATSYLSKKVEEVAQIQIVYENGMEAYLHLSWLSPVKIRNILIAGSKKMITYNDVEPTEKIKLYSKSVEIPSSSITPFSPAYRSGDIVIPHLSQTEALLTELKHFIDCIIKASQPITNGEEGLKVVRHLEAIDLSLRTNKEVTL